MDPEGHVTGLMGKLERSNTRRHRVNFNTCIEALATDELTDRALVHAAHKTVIQHENEDFGYIKFQQNVPPNRFNYGAYKMSSERFAEDEEKSVEADLYNPALDIEEPREFEEDVSLHMFD